MIETSHSPALQDLLPAVRHMWDASGTAIRRLRDTWLPDAGAPVFTARGIYTARGWTEWTDGFVYGSALLQFDATGDEEFLDCARDGIRRVIPAHVTHAGVHDHGFNCISTYGTLLRMQAEGTCETNREMTELALRCSGAVQAMRWSRAADGGGYIYSFNGPHSLFIDTIRSLRVLAVAHLLGHVLKGEGDRQISLLERLCAHLRTTARYAVYYGEDRDIYDVRGRVAHESIFNTNDGAYRCPNSQQGYSPFTTWTRGLGWAILGFAEQLEFLATRPPDELSACGAGDILDVAERAARATADFYCQSTPTDGVPYWDTGAPGLAFLENRTEKPSDPYNDFEPVDSSAAAIAAQGLLRLAHYLDHHDPPAAARYRAAGLTTACTLLDAPYLSDDPAHQGLLLHGIYHRPNGWDYIPDGSRIPCGEACMWGDYHLRELARYIESCANGESNLTFFAGAVNSAHDTR